jgi:hypothetical protein
MGIAKLTNEQRRVLHVLARHADGCAEAVLLADGLSVSQLVILVIEGFATMQRKRADVGGRHKRVVWLQISDAGQRAVEE